MEHLTEPGVRQYFIESFKTCKEYKLQYHTWLLNIGLLVIFVFIVVLQISIRLMVYFFKTSFRII